MFLPILSFLCEILNALSCTPIGFVTVVNFHKFLQRYFYEIRGCSRKKRKLRVIVILTNSNRRSSIKTGFLQKTFCTSSTKLRGRFCKSQEQLWYRLPPCRLGLLGQKGLVMIEYFIYN